MTRLSFRTSLLLAPLAYAVHHYEEHVLFSFRAWRLRYFADNNPLSTEAVLCILMAISLTYLFLHGLARSRLSAQMVLLFLMATQVHNAMFHVGGTLWFGDFSPGTITAVCVYLPVNVLILRRAFGEGLLDGASLLRLFAVGGAIFWTFELIGPVVLLIATALTWGVVIRSMILDRDHPRVPGSVP